MKARSSLRAYYTAAGVGNLLTLMKRWGADKFATTFSTQMRKSAKAAYGMSELDAALKKAEPTIRRTVKKWAAQQMAHYHSPEHQQNIKELGDHFLMRGYDALKETLAEILRAKIPNTKLLSDKKLQYIVNTIVDDAQVQVISQWLTILDQKQAKESRS